MRKDGFMGQKLIVFPSTIQAQLSVLPLTKGLFISDIGYFPNANNHLVSRLEPLKDNILIFCHQGEGWCRVEGKRKVIKAGHYFVIPSGTPHEYGSLATAFWEVSWVHFSGSVAADLARECCRGVYGSGISGGKYTRTFELFIDIISHLERGLTVESCSFASMQIWHYFADIIHFQQFSSHHEANPITSAIDFMTNHVEQNLTLEEICKEINLSPTYFCRAFKGKVGHTPIDYFIRMKIQRACQYLDLTELKVKEVSEKIGYDDPYYFSRLFKKIMAKSPSEYRETSHGLF